MPQSQRSYLFGADASPSTFVKLEAGENNSVVPCVAGEVAIGVTAEHSREAPIPGVTAKVALEGESAQVYGLGEPCEVTAGGSINAGDYLKPDANAKAVTALPGEPYSAISISDAAVNQKCKCSVERGTVPMTVGGTAAQQSLSGAGAINVTSYYTAWTTTGASQAGTLANGTSVGQLKKIQLIVDGGDGVLTPTSLSGGTTITFADAGDFVVLRWTGAAWVVLERGNDADGATGPVVA